MRTWQYVEPDTLPSGETVPRVVVMTDNEILESYYAYWAQRAIAWHARYPHREFPITPLACIEDWVVVHWAARKY